MDLPRLHGIITPLATPLKPDGAIDELALAKLVEHQLAAGVHGLWVLGTTARFDLLTDPPQRTVAEVVAHVAEGRVPLVLNVSDLGTERRAPALVPADGRRRGGRLLPRAGRPAEQAGGDLQRPLGVEPAWLFAPA